MIRRYVGLACLSLVLLLSSGCDEVVTFLEDVGIPPVGEADKQDPTIEAALVANQVVKDITTADNLLEEGLKFESVKPIKRAAALRPRDPKFEVYAGAMDAAYGNDKEFIASGERALEIIVANYPTMSKVQQSRLWLRMVLDSLFETRSHFGPSAERGRLESWYCSYLSVYRGGSTAHAGDVGVGETGLPQEFC